MIEGRSHTQLSRRIRRIKFKFESVHTIRSPGSSVGCTFLTCEGTTRRKQITKEKNNKAKRTSVQSCVSLLYPSLLLLTALRVSLSARMQSSHCVERQCQIRTRENGRTSWSWTLRLASGYPCNDTHTHTRRRQHRGGGEEGGKKQQQKDINSKDSKEGRRRCS